MADSNICGALDIVDDLLVEIDHIKNFLEILAVGFENDHNSTKECEVSCIYILSRYIDGIQNNELLCLYDTLAGMKSEKKITGVKTNDRQI